MTQRYLSPAEVKASLGLTTKALRLYEAHGLVKPVRTAKGWRAFAAQEVSRLYQIKILRNFGLSLERIAVLLKSPDSSDSLASVVMLQTDSVKQDIARLTAALNRLSQVQDALRGGQTLTLDDLLALGRNSAPPEDEGITDRIRPYVERYFTPDDYRAIERATGGHWEALVAESDALLMRNPDPATVEARELLAKWQSLSRFYSGGDAALEAKSAAMFAEAMSHADPSRHPIPLRVWTFVKQIAARMGEQT